MPTQPNGFDLPHPHAGLSASVLDVAREIVGNVCPQLQDGYGVTITRAKTKAADASVEQRAEEADRAAVVAASLMIAAELLGQHLGASVALTLTPDGWHLGVPVASSDDEPAA